MFRDAWELRREDSAKTALFMKQDAQQLQLKIDRLVDRLVDADSDSVVKAYEQRIERMQHDKRLLEDRMQNAGKPAASFEEMFELAMRFLSNPWKIWETGHLGLRRTVIRMAFSEPVSYCRKTGLRTAKTTLPFNMLGIFLQLSAEWWSLGGSNP
ncbi:hypothetical protein [Sedimentitalea nanhaiensis]|nr:hypothetical protein [Sedimentitalea nanhaiensis]